MTPKPLKTKTICPRRVSGKKKGTCEYEFAAPKHSSFKHVLERNFTLTCHVNINLRLYGNYLGPVQSMCEPQQHRTWIVQNGSFLRVVCCPFGTEANNYTTAYMLGTSLTVTAHSFAVRVRQVCCENCHPIGSKMIISVF